jgi:hypothetical protein
MKQPDVETLVAYAKGALRPEEARQIEQFLKGNSEVHRLIKSFRQTEGLAQAAFPAPARQARPQNSSDAIRKSPGLIGAGNKARPARTAGRRNRAAALAAALAMISGMGLGVFLLGRDEESPIALGRLSSIDALSSALSRVASGTPDIIGDRVVTVLTSFRDTAGRACRKFEVSDLSPTVSPIVAVACQDGGAWRIEGAARLTVGGSGSGESASAGSDGADALAGLLSRLGAGDAMAHEEETALIAQNWQQETGGP